MANAILDARQGDSYRRIEVITGQSRRRRWTAEEKARIVAESFEADTKISEVARRNGVARGLLTAWRRQFSATARSKAVISGESHSRRSSALVLARMRGCRAVTTGHRPAHRVPNAGRPHPCQYRRGRQMPASPARRPGDDKCVRSAPAGSEDCRPSASPERDVGGVELCVRPVRPQRERTAQGALRLVEVAAAWQGSSTPRENPVAAKARNPATVAIAGTDGQYGRPMHGHRAVFCRSRAMYDRSGQGSRSCPRPALTLAPSQLPSLVAPSPSH
jgi:transposase-like protein